jgi:uncharacterized repeat protein (TIGR01451 family)
VRNWQHHSVAGQTEHRFLSKDDYLMFKITQLLVLTTLLAIASQASAKPDNDLAINMVQAKVVVKDGKETLETADEAKPGDIIDYTAEYLNKGAKRITALEATIPVPAGTEYLSDSAKPAPSKASLDGKKFEAIPLKRKVKQADGKEVEQLVPYKEYRFMRWSAGDLGVGKSQKYSLRVKVEQTAAPAAKAQ